MTEAVTKEITGNVGTPKGSRKRSSGAPKGNTNARKHGANRLKVVLKDVGIAGISRQTTLGRELARRQAQIEKDAGGKENISLVKQDLIERYLRTILLIETIDNWIFQQRTIVRKRALYPVVIERTRLVDCSLRLAQAIGLDRQAVRVPTLEDLTAQVEEEKKKNSAGVVPSSPERAPVPAHSHVVGPKSDEAGRDARPTVSMEGQ
jgi:hypothetical protein